MKKVGFFSLGDLFIGNGMGKWGGENSLNTFGNMHHPRVRAWPPKIKWFKAVQRDVRYFSMILDWRIWQF